ncbi:MAG: TlyA family RNA methyltransferase [Anaerolineae bacterium]|nr:TlyA family RNA methyltransferase [Anaerolineae bacterium]
MSKPTKQRLDQLLVAKGLVPTRAKAQGMIMAGEVLVNGRCVDKAGALFDDTVSVTLKSRPQFVSRGGEKLNAALQRFGLEVEGRVAVDVGASTGGFSDCLLQRSVSKIYALDVGYGQMAQRVRDDARVVVMERTNARYVESLPEVVSLAVIDVSFISLRLILPAVVRWLAPQADVVALIKPQFEAGKESVGRGGIVRDERVHRQVLATVLGYSHELGLRTAGTMASPILGAEGNREFLAWWRWGADVLSRPLETWIEQAIADR